MAKPEHVDEGMNVGLRGEVDAGAHMSQGGVDVCGVGGTKAMNGLFVDLGLGVLSILWGVFCPHQTCKFQSEAERVKQSQLAIACPQACFLNYWIQNHVPRDALSCKCLESHSHIMRLTYSMYSSMAVSGCTMHCHASRRPYLQCLYPKHVLNLPGMIANS